MFTKKPEAQPDSAAPARPADKPTVRPADEALGQKSPQSADKFGGSTKMAPSIIGEDLSVTGNIVSKGAVQVDGEVQGDIHCASLVVGEKARVTGGLKADDVVVCGNVSGSIRATNVTLQSSSHVEGDIFHKSIAIEQGAFFEGKSRRDENPRDVKIDSPARPQRPQGEAQGPGSPPGNPEHDSKPPQAAE